LGTLIGISSPQVQLRQNHTLLLLVGGVSSVAGLFLWSAPPFIWSNPKDKVGVCLRYLSLFSSLSCGITAVASGKQLGRIAPLIKAIETAERADFLDQLASSQYVQQTQYQQAAMTALQPPAAVGNDFFGNGCNDELPSGNEVVTDSVTDSVTNSVTDATDTATLATTEAYKPTYLAVISLQQQGASDSKIIKEVLGQEGRNYERGKEMLETLLQLGQSEGW
jgi:hypothetical protein